MNELESPSRQGMARQGITEAEAFHSIQRQSMKTRTPMQQIAEAILVAEAVAEVSTAAKPARLER